MGVHRLGGITECSLVFDVHELADIIADLLYHPLLKMTGHFVGVNPKSIRNQYAHCFAFKLEDETQNRDSRDGFDCLVVSRLETKFWYCGVRYGVAKGKVLVRGRCCAVGEESEM